MPVRHLGKYRASSQEAEMGRQREDGIEWHRPHVSMI
jgi:hypothetical protein